MLENPNIERRSIYNIDIESKVSKYESLHTFREVLLILVIRPRIDLPGRRALREHGQYIWRTKRVGVAALVEDGVE